MARWLVESATGSYGSAYASSRKVTHAHMTYSESRAKYAETFNAVVNDREEVVITRTGHEPVVMVSLDDYESLKKTAYLLRIPENARRLLASITRLEAGEGVERDLAE
jgi:antitoxin YefM